MEAPSLFMVYVGGHMPQSNVEVHDIRFVVGTRIEEAYEDPQNQWWGDPDTLHLDCWGKVEAVDGYAVSLQSAPQEDGPALGLYFVNLGGYDPEIFDELHKNMLVVAKSEAWAKTQAKETVTHWKIPHKDTLFEVEKALDVSALLAEKGLYLHLEKTEDPPPFAFECLYTPISKKALAKGKAAG